MENLFELTEERENQFIVKEVHYAGFFVRLLARTLDFIIIVAIINILFYVDDMGGARGWWPPMPIPGDSFQGASVYFSTVNIIRGLFYVGIHPLYYILLHGMGGQTIGKLAFRIKVVTHNEDEISMGQSILRWLGYVICDITLGIGYLFVAFTRHKQGLHDKIANTFVIYP